MSTDRLKEGDIVKHFTWETKQSPEDLCIYKIVKFGYLLDDVEKIVIYKGLYSKDFYVKRYDDFMGEVDHVKYPHVTQKYKYEKIDEDKNTIQNIYDSIIDNFKEKINK